LRRGDGIAIWINLLLHVWKFAAKKEFYILFGDSELWISRRTARTKNQEFSVNAQYNNNFMKPASC
jgi:hypothetical protein